MWFKSITEHEGILSIPIIDTEEFCFIKWGEDEAFDEVYPDSYCSLRSNICFDENYDIDNGLFQILHIHEVICYKTKKMYLLVSMSKIEEYDDMFHTVCLPYNYLNILKFYKEYVMTFQDEREE